MIRIGKMTDYAILLLTHFSEGKEAVFGARTLSERSGLPLPTVSKILKTLCNNGILVSTRGIRGGYKLARAAREVSVAQIIESVEGPIALTECGTHSNACDLERSCPVKGNWQIISQTVAGALGTLSLEQMKRPIHALPERRV